MKIPQAPFYFIRHGETEWNRLRIYMGTQDIPLNQQGLSQALLAAELLKNEPISHIVASSLSRAMKTAEIIADTVQKPITIIDDLKECCWGVLEGEQAEDCSSILDKWLKGEEHEGAETKDDFLARVTRGLGAALELPGPVLIVSHGGVYRALSYILGIPAISLQNCAAFYHKPPEREGQLWVASSLNSEDIESDM